MVNPTFAEILSRSGVFIIILKNLGAKQIYSTYMENNILYYQSILKNMKATSNKMAFDWVVEQDNEVNWIREARWVHDGKYYTSSGVSAGIDMTLGFVRDMMGVEIAEKIAKGIEYIWNRDNDPFC